MLLALYSLQLQFSQQLILRCLPQKLSANTRNCMDMTAVQQLAGNVLAHRVHHSAMAASDLSKILVCFLDVLITSIPWYI
jgi:hypothetical protein